MWTPRTSAPRYTRACDTSSAAGRTKNQVTMRSRMVERPRKNANPRTEPTDRYHSTPAPMSETMSAARIVRHALLKLRGVEARKDLPARTSSFSRSRKTT